MDNQDGEANDVKNEPPLHHDIQMKRKQRRNTEDYLKVKNVLGGDRIKDSYLIMHLLKH